MDRKMRAMLLSPLSNSYQGVKNVLATTLEESGVLLVDVDSLSTSGLLVDSILDSIKSVDFLIADISGQNANILYELGFAYALRKPALLILDVSKSNVLPQDLAGYQTVFYDSRDLETFRQSLSHFVQFQVYKQSKEHLSV